MTTPDPAEPVQQLDRRPSQPPRRPNFGKIHAKPLPLIAYPLPNFIPHNPLSLLHIAFVYLYQTLTSPSSHPQNVHKAYWSPETRSIHVTDAAAILALWECGFFGKGSLSRSEPSWLDREKRRRGLIANETSEEFTTQRREERKRFKKERARKEREAIEEKLAEERRSRANGTPEPTARARHEGVNQSVDSLVDSIENLILQEPASPAVPAPILLPAQPVDEEEPLMQESQQGSNGSAEQTIFEDVDIAIENQEHLQLTASEAFFLTYGLGILEVIDPATLNTIPNPHLFTILRAHSYFPPLLPSQLQPDDPFLLSYIAYHHFRSLGWVVRPGIKFAVDWLLYLRGPVFSHAEFATIVLPAYTDPYWRSTPEIDQATNKKESKSWWWLHCVNRVQSQVRKSLILVYVDVPAPSKLPVADDQGMFDVGVFLGQYKVRELTIKRWISNRERD